MRLGVNNENVLGLRHTFASLGKYKETRPKHSYPMGVTKEQGKKHEEEEKDIYDILFQMFWKKIVGRPMGYKYKKRNQVVYSA